MEGLPGLEPLAAWADDLQVGQPLPISPPVTHQIEPVARWRVPPHQLQNYTLLVLCELLPELLTDPAWLRHDGVYAALSNVGFSLKET